MYWANFCGYIKIIINFLDFNLKLTSSASVNSSERIFSNEYMDSFTA